ncbi:MAG: Wzz/FepE/Etk N-terminal domain-containing protein [Candidatus Latescibacterota bacterium]
MNRFGSLRSVLLVLFKRKWLILSVLVPTVAVVTLGSMLQKPTYRATAKMTLERENDPGKGMLFGYSAPRYEQHDWIRSEIEILSSHPVASQVVRDLKLDALAPDEEPPASPAAERTRFELIVQAFQAGLEVDNPSGTNVVEVAYSARSPEQAAEVVNHAVATYMQHRTELYDESNTYRFFAAQLEETEERLRRLEAEAAAYKNREEVIYPPQQAEILLDRLAGYEAKLTEVRTTRIGKGARLQALEKQLVYDEVTIPATDISDSPSQAQHITRLRGELLDMEMQRSQLLRRYRPGSEEIVDLDTSIAVARQKIRSEVEQIAAQERTAIAVLELEEQALDRSRAQINQEIRQLALKEYEVNQLSRGIEDTREVYSMLLRQREDARISLAKLEKGVMIRPIAPAVPPAAPDGPPLVLRVALAGVVGIVGGLGIAVLAESANHALDTAEQVERMVGLAVLGSVRDRAEWRTEITA